jgi:hypothetical protein
MDTEPADHQEVMAVVVKAGMDQVVDMVGLWLWVWAMVTAKCHNSQT